MGGENRVQITIAADGAQARSVVDDVRQALVSLGGAGAGARTAEAALRDLGAGAAEVRTALGGLNDAIKILGRQVTELEATNKAIRDMGGAAADAGTKLAAIGNSKADLAAVRDHAKQLQGGIQNASKEVDILGKGISDIKSLLGGLGLAFGAQALIRDVADLGVAVFETGKQLESLDLSLKAITGSSAGAQTELAAIKQIAKEYGQDYLSMAQSSKTFLAASKDTELAGAGARDVIRGVSAAVAALGLSQQDAQGVMLALGQMMSKGTVQAEELRGQLGERLPGAFGLAAKAMGVTTAELGKMLEQGQVVSTDMVPKLARALEQEYGQAAKEAGNTGAAAANTLHTSWTELQHALGDAGAFDIAKKLLRELATVASETAQSLRTATGTLTGDAKVQFLTARIKMLEDGLERNTGAQSEEDIAIIDTSAWRKALDAAKKERAMLQSDMLDTQRSENIRVQSGVTERDLAKSDSLVKASQQATMDIWAKSSDPVTAAWAKFEAARAKSWKEVYSGKINQGAFEQEIAGAEAALKKAQDDAAKKGASGANAAERGDIHGSEVLQRIEDEIAGVEAMLGGDRLGASIAKIERDHNRALAQIQKDLVGAKGGMEALHTAEERLGVLKTLKIKAAELADFVKQLDEASKHESDLAKYSYGAQGSQLKSDWLQGYKQYLQELQQAGLGTDLADPQKIADAEARWTAHQQFMLDEDVRRLGEGGKLSDEYWAAEGRRLDGHLAQVKQHVTDENAFQVYASQKRSELRRQELEARLGYEEDFLGYLKDYMTLEFKLYQDQTTREREMWRDVAKSTVDYMRQIGSDINSGLSDALAALWEGNSQKAQESWRNMWSNILRDSMRYLTDLAMTLAKQYLVIPIVGQMVGIEGADSLGLTANGQSGGNGLSMSSVSKYGGMAKDAYNMLGAATSGVDYGYISASSSLAGYTPSVGLSSTPATSGLWGSSGAPIFDGVGINSAAPTVSATAPTTAASSSLMSGLGAAAAAGGLGYTIGGYIRPDNPTASYVGAGAGVTGAGIASMAGLGMLGATGVGLLAAIPAALIAGLATPNTTKSEWTTAAGSAPAVYIVDGQSAPLSWGSVRTTSSGMFGSQSTSHSTMYYAANDQISSEVNTGMETATAGLKSFSKALGQSEDEFKETMKGLSYPPVAIPEGYESTVYRNMAELQTEYYLDKEGLKSQVDAIRQSGEAYIDVLTRIETAANTATPVLESVGLSLERLSGSADRLTQGDWASQAIAAAGGTDQFSAIMTRYSKMVYSDAEQSEHALTYFATQAKDAMGSIKESGVDLLNFREEYRRVMEAGNLSPDQFAAWGQAAAWVEQAYAAANTLAQQQIQTMQATRTELASQVQAWESAKNTLRSFYNSLKTDETYSNRAPKDVLAERQSLYNEYRDKAKVDPAYASQFAQYAKDFRDYAYEYYGTNEEYAQIQSMIETDTAGLVSVADSQYQATQEQIARLDTQITLEQQQMAALATVNSNLGHVAGAVEGSGSAIVAAINSLGGNDGGGYSGGDAAAIDAANQQLQQQILAALGMSTSYNPWDGAQGFADGGLVTGGIPGVDSVPIVAMPGERILSVEHSRLIERLADSSSPADMSTLERLMAALLTDSSRNGAALQTLLARVDSRLSVVASNLDRVVS